MYVPSLTHYEFLETACGALMVTLDVRKAGLENTMEPESSLKFWYWDTHNAGSQGLSANHRYKLAAQVRNGDDGDDDGANSDSNVILLLLLLLLLLLMVVVVFHDLLLVLILYFRPTLLSPYHQPLLALSHLIPSLTYPHSLPALPPPSAPLPTPFFSPLFWSPH